MSSTPPFAFGQSGFGNAQFGQSSSLSQWTWDGFPAWTWDGFPGWMWDGSVLALQAVTGLAALVVGLNQITLEWNALTLATSYDVYMGTASGAEVLLASGVPGPAYVVSGLLPTTPYYFKVAGVNVAGVGPLSSELVVTTLTPLVTPPLVQATAAGFYDDDYKDIGDVFYLSTASDFSDSAQSQVPAGNPDYPVYGWMKQVPAGTPLFSWASSGNASPRLSPRRTVL